MKETRRKFIKKSALGAAGMSLAFSARSYGRILGANDRVRVGIVGFSGRFRGALLPAFMEHADAQNFEFVAVSDIWNRRRKEGVDYIKEKYASAMGMEPFLLKEFSLADAVKVETDANTGADNMTSAHMLNWMECARTRKAPHADVKAGYNHAVANIMCTAALHTGKRVTFDDEAQDIVVS